MPNRRTLCIDLRWIDCSGVGMYIKGILPGIVEQLKHVTIVGLGDRSRLRDFDWSRAENVRLVDCRSPRYSLSEQIQLPRAIPQGVDLFFSPYYTIPLLYRGRLAVTVHDVSHLILPEIVNDTKKRLYARIMYRALRRRASAVFAVSNFTKGELLRLSDTGLKDNIIVTPLGVAPEWYEAGKADAVHSRPYFIFVGNVKPHKNLGRLVDAYLQIKDRIPHDLILAGQVDGMITGEAPRFFESVKAAGPRIHMTGFVSDRHLLALLGRADALVMPSLYEGFGLPPLEAMAAGVPVLAARAASMPEVCGEAALYFDPRNTDEIAESLVKFASNPDMGRTMRESGLQRSRQFTWESCANITARVLETCLDGR
jgi:glycosyltransferase involved in cell wall biosynthesis